MKMAIPLKLLLVEQKCVKFNFTNINILLTKKYWILIGMVVVLLGGTLTYFGCIKQQSGPASLQPEQTKQEQVRQVIIPSSLDPKDVMESLIIRQGLSRPYFITGKSKEEHSTLEQFWENYFGIFSSGRGLSKYAYALWMKIYYTKDGKEIYDISEKFPFILDFFVFKYEKPEFAQEDYNKISTKQQFRIFTLKGIELKSKHSVPPTLKERFSPYVKQERCYQYLLHSNNFIIYAFGIKEAAEDVMIRVIDQYMVK